MRLENSDRDVSQGTLWDWTGSEEQERGFAEYDAANPHIWRQFVRFTFDLIRVGRTHHSADSICHRIRFETALSSDDPSFKLNNNWTAYYARKFHRSYPEHVGFFSTRRSRADRVQAA